MTVVVFIVIMLGFIAFCHAIAKKRGANPVFWGVMGGLFGPLALPFVFFSGKKTGTNDESQRAIPITDRFPPKRVRSVRSVARRNDA